MTQIGRIEAVISPFVLEVPGTGKTMTLRCAVDTNGEVRHQTEHLFFDDDDLRSHFDVMWGRLGRHLKDAMVKQARADNPFYGCEWDETHEPYCMTHHCGATDDVRCGKPECPHCGSAITGGLPNQEGAH